MLSDISDIILSPTPFLPYVHSSPLHFEFTVRKRGKFHFHPGKPYSKGLWIVVEEREKKKRGGANRRVELDKVPRLQIRDWNLHDGIYIYKSFEDNKKIDEEIFWLFRFVLLLKNS